MDTTAIQLICTWKHLLGGALRHTQKLTNKQIKKKREKERKKEKRKELQKRSRLKKKELPGAGNTNANGFSLIGNLS